MLCIYYPVLIIYWLVRDLRMQKGKAKGQVR